MTVCNMSIEAGARAGLIAPDEITFAWLKDARARRKASDWDDAPSRAGARCAATTARVSTRSAHRCARIRPTITWGTHPGMVVAVDAPRARGDERAGAPARSTTCASNRAGRWPARAVDVVFVGSCTNSRLPDLRAAADVLARTPCRIARVRMLVVPGSEQVKREAEREGIDAVVPRGRRANGASRAARCASRMNGDIVEAGPTRVSTSNRNFEGRQGPGVRTVLASPLVAAAAALAGHIADPREYLAPEAA